MKLASCVLFFYLLIAQLAFSQKLNQLNKGGERKGKWVIYIDSANTIKSFEGKFRNGKPIGKSNFYNNNGVLDRTEVNRFKKLKTTFYYASGVVKMTGNARLENLPDKIHYYYYGKWKAYNDSGHLVKYYYYHKGNLIKTEYIDKNNKTNDSLIKALTEIDQEFARHNTALTDSINANLKNEIYYNKFKNELRYKDSLSFLAIDVIMQRYGYPSPKIAGDVNGVPFYILGFAPLALKEKHLNELILAADRGYINWKSLAFYVDKVKVAKGEKQVYGTQGTYDKDYNYTMYPVVEPEKLNERRLKVGLESISNN